jgi:hypothetical protein
MDRGDSARLSRYLRAYPLELSGQQGGEASQQREHCSGPELNHCSLKAIEASFLPLETSVHFCPQPVEAFVHPPAELIYAVTKVVKSVVGPALSHRLHTARLAGSTLPIVCKTHESVPTVDQPAQTQALPPESAQISAAIWSCSAFGAFCGSPWPPYSSQVEGRIW